MAGNSFECCKPSSDGYNFYSSCSQKYSYSEDAYSDDPYRHLNAYWYQQSLWSQYWLWSNNQHTVHQTRNHFPTWCSTCVEEREQRKRRVNLRKGGRCDNNIRLGKQTSSEPLCKNMLSRNQVQGLQQIERNEVTESTGYSKLSEAHLSDTEESSSDEFEMELNNDFKKFLEQSAKHKEERRKEAILSQVKTDDYIEAGEIALEATTVAPVQQQGILRTEEMKSLYGASAHHIESLETSLQLHFNMNVDMRHPMFWPSIPLKF